MVAGIPFGIALVLAIALSGCAGGEAAIRETTLSALVLQPADLSDEFVQFDEGPVAISDTPLGERSDPERFGRMGGWKARYRKSGPDLRGPLVVESRVELFEDNGGAEREYELHVRELDVSAGERSPERLRDIDIGDGAVALLPAPTEAGFAVGFIVVWREENAVATITATGVHGKLVLRNVLPLVQRQQKRMAVSSS